VKIIAISDVHGKWNKLEIPECDILISAGDYSFRGEPHMVRDYHKWLNKQEAGHIISVQGNHELWVEKNFNEAKLIAQEVCPAVHFIDHGVIEIEGIKFYCSAATPWFHDWAWNYHSNELKRHWGTIPKDTNILVTHGPPYMICDEVISVSGCSYDPPRYVGCNELREAIKGLPNLTHHIFGHIHCGHGQIELDGVKYYNVSICGESYNVDHEPTVIDYEKK
jgi:Icc-related predicted phosphoesterase